MANCIRKRITVLKIVIWGGKLLVLWSQIAFYGLAGMSIHKTDDLPPQMTVLSIAIPFLMECLRQERQLKVP